jgi:hypothetical protein
MNRAKPFMLTNAIIAAGAALANGLTNMDLILNIKNL